MSVPKKSKNYVVHMYVYLDTLSNAEYYQVNNIQIDFEKIKQDFENILNKNLVNNKDLLSPSSLELKITAKDRHRVVKTQATKSSQKDMPKKEFKIDGQTLLHKALTIPDIGNEKRDNALHQIIEMLVKYCPNMITVERYDKHSQYTGITPLHLAIIKQDVKLLKKILEILKNANDAKPQPVDADDAKPQPKEADDAKQQSSKLGERCTNTIMMAGFPLAVAALTLNKRILQLLVQYDVKAILKVNGSGDNMIHSLIRQANRFPEKVNGTLEMLNYLISNKETGKNKKTAVISRRESHQLLMMMNKEGLTPLLLATKLQQHEIFKFIMSSEVYRSTDTGGCMTEDEIYDITEIETIGIVPKNGNDKNKKKKPVCILEYLINQEPSVAFNIADVVAVREVIRIKWQTYRKLFYSWFIIHICFMMLITTCGVRRSNIFESAFETGFSNDPGKASFKIKVKDSALFLSGTSIGLVVGLFYITIELFRCVIYRKFRLSTYIERRNFRSPRPYSDFTFRVLFIVFALLLISDFGAAFSDSYEHNCLTFAIIIGWYILLFFLKTLAPFSFFAVLIERALIELVKFAIVMGILLIGFSAAMYMVMQGAKNMDSEESFRYFKTTILKMFMIMVGLGDLTVLLNARQPIMSVIIFIMFVLLTTILLFNALLALMSEICGELINNRNVSSIKIHARLHQLSAILFLEGMLPIRWCKEVGTREKVCRFDMETESWKSKVPRRFLTWTQIRKSVPKFKQEESRSIGSTLFQVDEIAEKLYNELCRATENIVESGKSVSQLVVKEIEKHMFDICGEEDIVEKGKLVKQLVDKEIGRWKRDVKEKSKPVKQLVENKVNDLMSNIGGEIRKLENKVQVKEFGKTDV